MPPISHKYLEKLQKEVSELSSWLNTTHSQDDGSARPDDLKALYKRVYSIYQKSLALHQTTIEDPVESDELEELRQDVANFDYWLTTEINPESQIEERQTVFTRANAISLKALSLYRSASQTDGHPQEVAGDEEHASLSGS